jgi:hypothetical protein
LLNLWLLAAPVSGLGFTEIVYPPRAEDWRVAFFHHQSHKKRAQAYILVPSYQERAVQIHLYGAKRAASVCGEAKGGVGRDSCGWMTMPKD